jgi:hypothetical protein
LGDRLSHLTSILSVPLTTFLVLGFNFLAGARASQPIESRGIQPSQFLDERILKHSAATFRRDAQDVTDRALFDRLGAIQDPDGEPCVRDWLDG